MASEDIKLARINDRAATRAQLIGLLQHPLYSVLVFFVLIEALQTIKLSSGKMFMDKPGTILETAAFAEIALNALGKSGVIESLGKLGGAVAQLAPLLVKP